MAHLIALHGRRGAGKDTVFGYINEWCGQHGVHAAKRGFADMLKLSFTRLFIPDASMEESVIWCDELKSEASRSKLSLEWVRGFKAVGETQTTVRHEITGRMVLQRFGTESHRNVFGDNFWVDALLPLGSEEEWVSSFIGTNPLINETPEFCAITDLRFENEAERVHELQGVVWEIVRDTGIEDHHASEGTLSARQIDDQITNHSGLEELRWKVYKMMDDYFKQEVVG